MVRSMLDRELVQDSRDVTLLCLERMRMIDAMHDWSGGTLRTYSGHIKRLTRFEATFGVSVLRPSSLIRPPRSPAIGTAWAQLHHSITGRGRSLAGKMTFDGTRGVRSALSMFYTWDFHMSHAGRARRSQRHVEILPLVNPADELSYTFQQHGMAARLGRRARKSMALKHQHIKFMDDQLEARYKGAPTLAEKHEVAAAGTANLTLWLGGLRGGECFTLDRADVSFLQPKDGPSEGLPLGLGYVAYRLLPETKTDRFRLADVLISFYTRTGFSLGKWLCRLLLYEPLDGTSLFSTPNCRRWTSSYFRNAFAWPLLEQLWAQGDPSLSFVCDRDGQRVRDHFWSCHSWRRGINTFVRNPPTYLGIHQATLDEIYEHFRWTKARRNASEPMPLHYNEWDTEMRLAFTLLCC